MSQLFRQSLIVGICLVSSSWAAAAVKEYQLVIDENTINVTGKPVKKITVNGQFPAPLLEFEEGDEAIIRVKNNLKNRDSSIHWHGLLLPGIMDGVPGFNGYNGIRPQGEFVYKFKVRQNGTYWYHAHSKGQEQDGLYGALVIYPKAKKPLAEHEKTDKDYVVMLSDFHEQSSTQIQNNLKKSSDYYQNQRETVANIWQQIKQKGIKATWSDNKMWNRMRMMKTDLSDVTGYTFLVNGKTPEQNWTGMFKPNEKVRLRFINASAMSFFDVRIPHLKMTVVSADGQPVQPVSVDEFRIGTAETYDVIVEPTLSSYQIQAESIDRSGFAVGALQNEQMNEKPVFVLPKARPRAVLSMADMGHTMQGMDHSKMSHDVMEGMDHSKMSQDAVQGMDHSQMSRDVMQGMDHSKMSQDAVQGMDHSKMSHDAMEGMDHSQMSQDAVQGMDHSKMSQDAMQGMDHSQMSQDTMQDMDHSKMSQDAMEGMDHSQMSQDAMQGMDHSQMNHDAMQGMDHSEMKGMNQFLTNLSDETQKSNLVLGWANASTPVGNRALQYSDLKSLTPQQDTREATRELVVRLGGSMERYIWTMNGKKFSDAEPLSVKRGERVRIKFINDTMMAHPMHLHGMFVQLENGQSMSDMPNKHTIIVPPGQTMSALLTADEVGDWAIHCHLLYHMSAGMMTKLVVAEVKDSESEKQAELQLVKPNSTTVKGAAAHDHH